MDCKNLEDSSNILKTHLKPNLKSLEQEGKTTTTSTTTTTTTTAAKSSHSLSNTANNTNPIICAVCGSKEYITLHSQERNLGFGSNIAWNAPEVLKKNSLLSDFGQTFGPFNPLAQAINFPQLSLLHYPSNVYYSHFNSNLRLTSNPCAPIDSGDAEAPKGGSTDGDSSAYRDGKESSKKRSDGRRITGDGSFGRKDKSNFYKSSKEESRCGQSPFGNASDARNYPSAMQSPWMGNVCPIFPYTYASLAFPVNQPLIPVYMPVPAAKWQNAESRSEGEDAGEGSRISNSPLGGDASSVKNDEDKKAKHRDENNASEYDFEILARDLHIFDQKSNYEEEEEEEEEEEDEVVVDDDDDDEINIDELTSGLKIEDVNSGRELNSEKFFNSKEKWMDSPKEGATEKEDIHNWRLSPKINMQDCCIRPFSNENIWYETEQGEKKNWESRPEYECKGNSKQVVEQRDRIEDGMRIGDGVFYKDNKIWSQDRNRTKDDDKSKIRPKWKKGNETIARSKINFGDSPEISAISNDKNSEWSPAISKTELNNEMQFSTDKLRSLTETSRIGDLNVISDESSTLDVRFNDFAEENESATQSSVRSETAQNDGDKYSVDLNSKEIDVSMHSFDDLRKSGREEKAIAPKTSRDPGKLLKKPLRNDSLYYEWDKISEILGENMEDSRSGSDKSKQSKRISNVNIYDKHKSSIPKIDQVHAEKVRKIDCKTNSLLQHVPPSTTNLTCKIKKEEKPKFTPTPRSESPKIPVASSRKTKKTDDIKKRWLT